MNLVELLQMSKKSSSYYNSNSTAYEELLDLHVKNVLNLRTVKEGTAVAGSFCNKIMEIATNYSLDLIVARTISDIFQRIALDAKHTKDTGGYKISDWYQLSELLNKGEKLSREEVEIRVKKILKGEISSKNLNTSSEISSFDDDWE